MNSVFKLSNIFMILLGNAAMALGIVMFILPNGLMTGGTTGLSLIVGHYTSLPISAFVFLFNAVMFILGLVVLGRAFAMTTLLSTFFYPVALEFFQRDVPNVGFDSTSSFSLYRVLSLIDLDKYSLLAGNFLIKLLT